MKDNEKDPKLRQREQALREREQELRLRELELEIFQETQANEPPLYQTQKDKPVGKFRQPWLQKLMIGSKFFYSNDNDFLRSQNCLLVSLGDHYWFNFLGRLSAIYQSRQLVP
ncbi:MAG: hypothetical protein AAGF26_08750 [Cyanobacteria bacterium P01_G01_bin.49]